MNTEQKNVNSHNDEIRQSFSIQAEGFENASMNFSKKEFLDYTVQAIGLAGDEKVLEVAVSRLAFHHMLRPERAFSEMKRVLNPGGKLVLIDMEATVEGLREKEDYIECMRDPALIHILKTEKFSSLSDGYC